MPGRGGLPRFFVLGEPGKGGLKSSGTPVNTGLPRLPRLCFSYRGTGKASIYWGSPVAPVAPVKNTVR